MFYVVFWIALLATAVLLIGAIGTFFTNLSGRSLLSLDWSGYVVASDFTNPQPVITSLSGSWVVPKVNVSQKDTFSAAWIGIGGQSDQTLIQTGTEHDSINGTEVYYAWYELLPNDSIAIDVINVSVRDKITASINLVNSATNEWSIEIEDVTKGQKFSQNFIYDSSRLSAGWVVERPTVDSTLSTLAMFGTVTFTNASVTVNAQTGSISSFPFSQVIMTNRQNTQLVIVSSLTSKGSSFTVTYA